MDERTRLIQLLSEPTAQPAGAFRLKAPFAASISEADYRRGIERILAYIRAGGLLPGELHPTLPGPCDGRPLGAPTWRCAALSDALLGLPGAGSRCNRSACPPSASSA